MEAAKRCFQHDMVCSPPVTEALRINSLQAKILHIKSHLEIKARYLWLFCLGEVAEEKMIDSCLKNL